MQILWGGHHVLPAGLEGYRNLLESMHGQVSTANKRVCIWHVVISICFWSLRLPEKAVGCFKIVVDRQVYGFHSLLLGWKVA